MDGGGNILSQMHQSQQFCRFFPYTFYLIPFTCPPLMQLNRLPYLIPNREDYLGGPQKTSDPGASDANCRGGIEHAIR